MVLHCDNSYALVHWTWGGYQLDPYLTFCQQIFRLASDMEASWVSFSEPWRVHLLIFGSNVPKLKTAKLSLKGLYSILKPWNKREMGNLNSLLVDKQVERARGRSGQVTNSNFSRGHVYQQHISDAIQKGELWSWQCGLSCGHKSILTPNL